MTRTCLLDPFQKSAETSFPPLFPIRFPHRNIRPQKMLKMSCASCQQTETLSVFPLQQTEKIFQSLLKIPYSSLCSS